MAIYLYLTILSIFQDHFTKCKQRREGQNSVQDARQKNVKHFSQGVNRKAKSANATRRGKIRKGAEESTEVDADIDASDLKQYICLALYN